MSLLLSIQYLFELNQLNNGPVLEQGLPPNRRARNGSPRRAPPALALNKASITALTTKYLGNGSFCCIIRVM
jgi:hypothetical protein